MKRIIIIAAILLAGCTQPERAGRVLLEAGYTDIHMEGYDWMNCSKDDTYHDKFTATNRISGRKVSGVVCSGLLFRGSTIRLD